MPIDTILIADDSASVRRVLAEMLTPVGYTITFAADGAEALRMVQASPPHLILMDIRMPKMDGYEVCQRLKQDPATTGIPVLMVTGMDETDDIRQALQHGADGYIMKPFHMEQLRATIHEMLQRATSGTLPGRFFRKSPPASSQSEPSP